MSANLLRRRREYPYAELILILGLIFQYTILRPHQIATFIDMGAKMPPITESVVFEPVRTGAAIAFLATISIAALVSAKQIFRGVMCTALVLANACFLFALLAPMLQPPMIPHEGMH